MIGNRAWPITQEPKDIALSNLDACGIMWAFWAFKVLIKIFSTIHPDFFVKLDFEIAIDQKTRARDRTFEGVQDSGSATPIFGQ